MHQSAPIIIPLEQIKEPDEPLAGLSATRLGIINSNDIVTPPGFVVTTYAFQSYLEHHRLHDQFHTLWNSRLGDNPTELGRLSQRIQSLIQKHAVPSHLANPIMHQYLQLGKNFDHREVALRASTTLDWQSDHPHADHAHSITHVWGESNLMLALAECWAGFFTPNILKHYMAKQLKTFNFGLAVIVQEMVPAKVSGTLLTVDPVHNDKTQIIIEAVYGTQEILTDDDIEPDYYQVVKDSWEITTQHIHPQARQYIYSNQEWAQVPVPQDLRTQPKLTSDQITVLAQTARQLEHRFYTPLEINWILTPQGLTIVDTKPLHLEDHSPHHQPQKTVSNLIAIAQGEPARQGMVAGYLRHIKSESDIRHLHSGDIAFIDSTDNETTSIFTTASAVLVAEAGQTSHAAMTTRELHVPCIVGLHDQLEHTKSGTLITIDGRTGKVYRGTNRQPHSQRMIEKHHERIHQAPPTTNTATHRLLEITPALELSQVNFPSTSGIGYISLDNILDRLSAHPMHLHHQNRLSQLTSTLIEYLTIPCQKAAPHECIYHISSQTSDHYMLLPQSREYESLDPDPTIGFRGARRHLTQVDAFNAELAAIKHIRNKLSTKNLSLAIPWVRTPEEFLAIKRHTAAYGIVRSPSLKIYLCIDTPLVALNLQQYIEIGIDGIIINPHNIIQLLLGGTLKSDQNPLGYDAGQIDISLITRQAINLASKNRLTSYYHLVDKPQQVQINSLISQGITGVIAAPEYHQDLHQQIQQAEHTRLTIT